jgi:hypothetical protein
MPKVSEMIVSKFLKKEDFEDGDQVLTIKGVKLEDMPGDDGQQKWVLYFRELQKGMALNSTTIRVLEKGYGSDSDMWIGKKILMYVDPNVSFRGQVVGGLRLRTQKAPPATAATTQPATASQQAGAAEFSDDIPF